MALEVEIREELSNSFHSFTSKHFSSLLPFFFFPCLSFLSQGASQSLELEEEDEDEVESFLFLFLYRDDDGDDDDDEEEESFLFLTCDEEGRLL